MCVRNSWIRKDTSNEHNPFCNCCAGCNPTSFVPFSIA